MPVPTFPTLTVATPRLQVRPVEPGDAPAATEVLTDKQTLRWLPVETGVAGLDMGGSDMGGSDKAGSGALEVSTPPVTPEAGPPGAYPSGVDAVAWCARLATGARATGEGDHYGIVRREDDQFVGCLWARRTDWPARVTELGYAVASPVRGFGLAAEAVDALAIALLLEHGFQRVEMRVAPGNVASRRVAEKAGFTYEGLLRNAGRLRSGRVDLEVWSLVAADVR
jgi:[ribosomal protein S5]-alanine N-acetyltransferase